MNVVNKKIIDAIREAWIAATVDRSDRVRRCIANMAGLDIEWPVAQSDITDDEFVFAGLVQVALHCGVDVHEVLLPGSRENLAAHQRSVREAYKATDGRLIALLRKNEVVQ